MATADRTKDPEYRDVVKHLVAAQLHRLTGDDEIFGNPKLIKDSVPTTELEAQLDMLNHATKEHRSLFESQKYRDIRTGKLVDVNAIGKRNTETADVVQQTVGPPVLKFLEQLSRPVHAEANAAHAALTGKNIPEAAARGFLNKDKTSFSTVLADVGAPKAVQHIAGFGLDVVLDPTTYATFGTGSILRKEAERAAAEASRAALSRGASLVVADREARAAASRVLKDPKNDVKGLKVGMKAKVPLTDREVHIESSGRTTARLARRTGASKVAKKVRASRPVQATGKAMVHDFRPAERTEAQHVAIRRAQRRLRAETQTARRDATREGRGLRKALGDNDRDVIDALESGRPLYELGEKAPAARRVRKSLGETYDVKKSRGLIDKPFKATGPTDAQRYLPHIPERLVDPPKGPLKRKAMRVGTTKAAGEKGRQIRMTLAQAREDLPGLFSEDLARTTALHKQSARERAALSDFWGRIAHASPKLSARTRLDPERDMVFRVTPEGLVPLHKDATQFHGRLGKLDLDEVKNAVRSGDRHIVLNGNTFEEIVDRMSPGISKSEIGRAWDYIQGKWKTAVTVPLPSYHARNLIGDTFNAYLADTSAKSFAQAGRILNSRRLGHKAETRLAEDPEKLGRRILIGKKAYTHKQILKLAETHGVIDQGLIGRELADLKHKEGGRFTRAAQYREDLPRLATFLSALKRGKTADEAAEWSLAHHFDYGDITGSEAMLRKGLPFWTFFARNSRLQATKVLTRPGKYATLAKVFQNASQVAGFDDYDDYSKHLKDYEQRGLALPLKIDGQVYNVQMGLPATDLNQLTTSPKDWAQNIVNRMSFLKLVPELMANYSYFFEGNIERDNSPFVPAPKWVRAFPKVLRDKLGVAMYDDPRRGRILGWHAKVDYVARQLPESNFLVQQFTPVPGSRNQTPVLADISVLTGVKATPFKYSSEDTKIAQLYEQVDQIDHVQSVMRATGKNEDPTTKHYQYVGYFSKRYEKLSDQRADLIAQIDKLKAGRGDKTSTKTLERKPLPYDQALAKKYSDSAIEDKYSDEAIRKDAERLDLKYSTP